MGSVAVDQIATWILPWFWNFLAWTNAAIEAGTKQLQWIPRSLKESSDKFHLPSISTLPPERNSNRLSNRIKQEIQLLEQIRLSKSYNEYFPEKYSQLLRHLFVGDESTQYEPLLKGVKSNEDVNTLFQLLAATGSLFQLIWPYYKNTDNESRFCFPVDMLPAACYAKLIQGKKSSFFDGKVIRDSEGWPQLHLNAVEFFIVHLADYLVSGRCAPPEETNHLVLCKQVLQSYLSFFLSAPIKPSASTRMARQDVVFYAANTADSWAFFHILIELWIRPNSQPSEISFDSLSGPVDLPVQQVHQRTTRDTLSGYQIIWLQCKYIRILIRFINVLRLDHEYLLDKQSEERQAQAAMASNRTGYLERQQWTNPRHSYNTYPLPPIHYDQLFKAISEPIYFFFVAFWTTMPAVSHVLPVQKLWARYVEPWRYEAQQRTEVSQPHDVHGKRKCKPPPLPESWVQAGYPWYMEYVKRNLPFYTIVLKMAMHQVKEALPTSGPDCVQLVSCLCKMLTPFCSPLLDNQIPELSPFAAYLCKLEHTGLVFTTNDVHGTFTHTWRLAPSYKKFEQPGVKAEPVFEFASWWTNRQGGAPRNDYYVVSDESLDTFRNETVQGLRVDLVRLQAQLQKSDRVKASQWSHQEGRVCVLL